MLKPAVSCLGALLLWFAASGPVQAQTTLTVPPTSVEAASATLTIGNWPDEWYYKHTVPSGGACSAKVDANTAANVTGLSGNTSYTYKAYSDSLCTSELAEASAFLTKPGKPSTPTVAAGGGSGTLALSATVGGAGAISGWKYAQKEGTGSFGAWLPIASSASATLSHTVSGLDDGTDYQFKVLAENATGDGVESDASTAVAPLDETLTAGSLEAETATLTIANWPDEWYYKHTVPSGGACSAKVDANTAANVTGLSGNTSYTYKAYSDSLCTLELAEASAFLTKPGKPSTPTVAAGGGSGTLALSATVGGAGAISGWKYAQKEGTGSFGAWLPIASSASATLSHTVSGLDDGTDYQFKVLAENATGDGVESDASTAVAPLDETLTAGSLEAETATLTIANWPDEWYYKHTVPSGGACSAKVDANTAANVTGLSGNTSYTYKAYSDSLCTSELAEASAFLTKPGKPSTPTVAAGGGSGTLALSATVGGAGAISGWKYAQKEGTGSFGAWLPIASSASATLSHTVSGLDDGTDYQFKVLAENATGDGVESDASTAVAPLDETLTAGSLEAETATLTIANWPDEWYYKHTVPSGGACSAKVDANTAANVTGLSGNTSYTYKAYSDSLCTLELAEASAFLTKPGKPSTPTVAAGGGSGTLALSATVGGAGAISGWKYAQKEGTGSFGAWLPIASSASATLSHTVSGLDDGTDYQFKVLAENATGDGVESDASTAVAPLDETLTAGSLEAETATLTIANWPDEWYYKHTVPSGGACSAKVDANTAANVTGLSGNTSYTYKAYSDSLCTLELAEASAFLTKPGKPSTPTVAAGGGSGTLALSATVGGAGAISGWKYAQKEGTGSFGAWLPIASSASATLSHTVSGLDDGTDYQFKVLAENATGDGVESDASTAVAPLDETLTAGSLEAETATLTIANWPDEWYYKHTVPSGGACSAKVDANTAANVTGLSGNTSYTYKAYSDSLCTLELAEASAFLTKPGKPSTPTVAAGGGSGTLALSATVGGAGAISGWKYAQKEGTGSFGAWLPIASSASATLSHTVSGLDDGTDYQFKVLAENATGDGVESDASTAVAPLDETLTAGSLEAETATLTIANWPDEWYYKHTVPSGGACSAKVDANTAANVTGLSGNTSYTYKAYSDSLCTLELAEASAFLTKPGKPSTPTVAAGGGSGTLALSATVGGAGAISGWKYAQKEGTGSFGAWLPIASSASATLSHTVSGLDDGTDYQFKVLAENATGDGVESDASTAVAPLDETLTAGSLEAETATLTIANWPDEWYYKHTVPSGGACSAKVDANTAANVTGLSGNTSYTYKAYSDSLCTLELAEASAFLTKPGKPSTPTVAAGGGSGTLALSATVGGAGAISGWKYAQKEGTGSFGAWLPIASSASATLSHTVSGLDDGTDYQFKVLAENATGDGVESDASTAVAPLDETLTAGSLEAETATLTIANWPDEWYYKHTVPSGGACSAKVDANTAANVTGLSGNTSYTYKAYSDSLCTLELAEASAFLTKPGKPSTPTVAAGGGSGTLALSATVGGAGAISGWKYAQKEGTGSFGAWLPIASSASATLSHTVSGLDDGTDYQFKVLAENATGDGVESDASTAVAPLDETLTAGSLEAETATLTIANWPDEWYYKHTVPSGGACSAKVDANTAANVTGLSGNTSYTYKAYSDSLCTSELAEASAFLTKPGKPSTPTVAAGGGSGTLALSATVGGAGAISGWKYAQKEGTGSFGAWLPIASSASATLSHTVSGLDDGTDYQFKVLAENATGDGVESDASTAVAPLDETLTAGSLEAETATLTIANWPDEWYYKHTVPSGGACSAKVDANTAANVTGLSGNTSYTYKAYSDSLCTLELAEASAFLTKPGKPSTPTVAAGGGSGTLALSATVGGAGAISGWKYAQKEGTGSFGAWLPIASSASATLSHTVSGLDDGTDYQFKVLAENATGDGVESDASTAVAPLDETLTAGSLEAETATLTIANWPDEWYYKHTVPSGGACSAKVDANTAANVTGLSGNTSYTYKAYSDSLCTSELAYVEFLTKPGKPATPTVAINENGGELVLSSSVSGDGAITGWQYDQTTTGTFGDNWTEFVGDSASTSLSHTIKGLDNYRSYQFRVRAVNITGPGLDSDGSAATARADAELTGADAAQNAWIAPFARTIAGQALDILAERFAAPPDTQFVLGGESIPLAAAGKDAVHDWAEKTSFSTRDTEVRTVTDEELMLGSSFHLTNEGDEGPEGRWAIWGRASLSRMEDIDDGVAVSGEVTTGVLGMDWERGRWLAGLALARSNGDGQLSQDERSYESKSTMTSVSPYLRLRLSERLLVWGLVGGGRGDLRLEEKVEEGEPIVYSTDLQMTIAAAGMQSELLTPEETGGYRLALKGDAFWVRTKSEAMVSDEGRELLAATSADSSRLRLALEGSRPFRLEDGATLTPMVEVGVRHDDGDAETGAGLDFVGGIAYSAPDSRFRAELRAQTLVLHADSDRREWGLSGSFRLLADDRGHGLSASISQGRGTDIGGSDRLWNAGAVADLAAGDAQSSDRLETEVGYGFSAFGGRMTQTPYLGYGDADGNSNLRLGWRLAAPTGLFETSLEAIKRQEAGGGSDGGIGLLATARW